MPKVKTISYGSNSITLKATKQWNEIQNFIKIDIYSPKMTYYEFLKSFENYAESEQQVMNIRIMLYTVMKSALFTMT